MGITVRIRKASLSFQCLQGKIVGTGSKFSFIRKSLKGVMLSIQEIADTVPEIYESMTVRNIYTVRRPAGNPK